MNFIKKAVNRKTDNKLKMPPGPTLDLEETPVMDEMMEKEINEIEAEFVNSPKPFRDLGEKYQSYHAYK